MLSLLLLTDTLSPSRVLLSYCHFSKLSTCFLLLIALCVVGPSSLYSQTATSQKKIPDDFFALADSLFKSGDYAGAEGQYREAVDHFDKLGMIGLQAKALNKLSEMQWRMRRLDEAKVNANLVLSLYQNSDFTDSLSAVNQAMSFNSLGVISGMSGDMQGALQAFKNVIEVGTDAKDETRTLLGIAHHNIGRLYTRFGLLDSALIYYTKSLEFKDINSPEDQLNIADTYYAIGVIYSDKFYDEQALEYLEKAIEIQNATLGPKHPQLALSSNVIGIIYSNLGQYNLAIEYINRSIRITEGKPGMEINTAAFYSYLADIFILQEAYDEALHYQNKCLRLRRSILPPNDVNFAYSYDDLAKIYFGKDELSKAEDYAFLSIQLKEDKLFESTPSLINTYALMARIYHAMNNDAQAFKYVNKAIDILQRNLRGKHPSLSDLFNLKGDFYIEKNQIREALSSYQLAIENNDVLSKEAENQAKDDLILLHSLSSKGHAYYLLFNETGSVEALKSSMEVFAQCDRLMDAMRHTYLRYEDKVAFRKTSAEVYSRAVNVALVLSDLTKDDGYKQRAFFLTEKSKVSALSEQAADLAAKEVAGLPDSLLRLEKSLKIDLSRDQAEINELLAAEDGYDKNKMDEVESQRFNVRQKLDSLNDYLEKNHASYFELKYGQDIRSIPEIQVKISDQEAVLEYLETDSALVTFLVTKYGYEVYRTPLDTPLASRVERLASIFNDFRPSGKTMADFEGPAYSLYKLLLQEPLAKLDSKINKLIVIPTPTLSAIPWEILTAEKPASELERPNYLLDSYTVGYAYSSSLHFKDRKRRSGSKTNTILAFAPSYLEDPSNPTPVIKEVFRDGFTPLNWNRTEAKSIEKFFDRSMILEADDATEAKFKSEASDYQILHLAMHAFVDHEEAMRSKLIFTQDNDSIEDGALHTYELYNMELDADLAILSACQSGYGKLEQGEGIVSLARGFAYAGVPSVIMSHWKVDDKSTSILMESFYKYLAEGSSKGEALRKAKLEFLEQANLNKQHPFYWGAFVVIGDDSPISSSSKWTKMYWIVGVLFILVIVLVQRKRNSSAQIKQIKRAGPSD